MALNRNLTTLSYTWPIRKLVNVNIKLRLWFSTVVTISEGQKLNLPLKMVSYLFITTFISFLKWLPYLFTQVSKFAIFIYTLTFFILLLPNKKMFNTYNLLFAFYQILLLYLEIQKLFSSARGVCIIRLKRP